MDQKIQSDLEKATLHFQSQELREAYVIFKRYFDRLPFQQEKGHLKYIGMFVRTLFELGKEREIDFYRATIEKIYKETKAPEIGYQLAFLNLSDDPIKLKTSKALLEEVISSPEISTYKNKAKIFLAYCYDILYKDTASVRKIIDSIEGPLDIQDERILITWKARILRDEGNFEKSKKIILEFLDAVTFSDDWYSHIIARFTLAYGYLKEENLDKVKEEASTIREYLNGKSLRTLEVRLMSLEKEISKHDENPPLRFYENEIISEVSLNGKKHILEKNKKTDAILLELLKEGQLSNDQAAKILNNGKSEELIDSNQIYTSIHSVRKLLEKLGISKEAIVSTRGGYRFIPIVERVLEDV